MAIAANDHTYIRTYPIFADEIVENGTVYMQCPSSDGDRGVDLEEPMSYPNKKIAFRYATGLNTIAGIFVEVKNNTIKNNS